MKCIGAVDNFVIVLVPSKPNPKSSLHLISMLLKRVLLIDPFNYYLISLSNNQIIIIMSWWKFVRYSSLSQSYSFLLYSFFLLFGLGIFPFSIFHSCNQKVKGKCDCISIAHMIFVSRSLYFDLKTLLYSNPIKRKVSCDPPIKLNEGDAPFVQLFPSILIWCPQLFSYNVPFNI